MITALGPASSAGVFKNQFIEFETPERWSCALEGTEYVCQDTRPEFQREAIIVLAAKLRGEQDSLTAYRDYLSRPREFKAPNGKRITSRPLKVSSVVINGLTWITSIHEESEIPGFRTHYFATVRDPIAVLVTFSIRTSRYGAVMPKFETMISTLKIKYRK
ncbi:MAG TPA: hypothetical protein VGD37_23680 [Kofleriaceae bacterium]